jgi:hypothetical protein
MWVLIAFTGVSDRPLCLARLIPMCCAPLGWLTDYDDNANYLAVRAHRDRETALMRVAAMSQVASEQVFPPQVSETDKDGT